MHHVFGFLGSSCLGSLPLPRLGNSLVLPTERQVPFPPVSFPIAVNVTSIWGHQCSLCFTSLDQTSVSIVVRGEKGPGEVLHLSWGCYFSPILGSNWILTTECLDGHPRAVNSLNRHLTGNNLDSVNHFWWTPLPSILLPLSLVTPFLSASLKTLSCLRFGLLS